MQVSHENENGITQIIIKGRLDAVTAPQAGSLIKEAIGEENVRLLFNLCDLDYIRILQTAKNVYKKGGQIVLCCSNENVRELLEISQLPIAETVEAGIDTFA
jgi:anti-anti-sigma factor